MLLLIPAGSFRGSKSKQCVGTFTRHEGIQLQLPRMVHDYCSLLVFLKRHKQEGPCFRSYFHIVTCACRANIAVVQNVTFSAAEASAKLLRQEISIKYEKLISVQLLTVSVINSYILGLHK